MLIHTSIFQLFYGNYASSQNNKETCIDSSEVQVSTKNKKFTAFFEVFSIILL